MVGVLSVAPNFIIYYNAYQNGNVIPCIHCGESASMYCTALAIVLKPCPISMPVEISYCLRSGRDRYLDCMWDVQTHSGSTVFLVLLCKDMSRMYGTPHHYQSRNDRRRRDLNPDLSITSHNPLPLDHFGLHQNSNRAYYFK